MDDEPARSSSNKVEGKTRYQRQLTIVAGFHHLRVCRIDRFHRADDVVVTSAECCDANPIARQNSFKFSKKCVSVSGNDGVTFGAGQRSPRYMSRTSDQGTLLDTLKNHH